MICENEILPKAFVPPLSREILWKMSVCPEPYQQDRSRHGVQSLVVVVADNWETERLLMQMNPQRQRGDEEVEGDA